MYGYRVQIVDKVLVTVRSFLCIVALMLAWNIAMADGTGTADRWIAGGDLRAGFFADERDRRDDGKSSDESLRARLRVFLERNLSPNWLFRSRLAGTFTTAGNDFTFNLDRYRATRTGTLPGEFQFDEFYFGWADEAGRNKIRMGRFQTGFSLPVVPGKSLDRNDSSNVGIGWTDGVYWQRRLSGSWEAHAIAQLNHRRGASNTARFPLSFSESGSRVGTYLALRSVEEAGPVIMRMLTVHWAPDALATHGPDDPRRDDYLTITAKGAAQWPLGRERMRFVLAGEFGHAPNRPQRGVMGIGGEGEVGGNAYQVSANVFDIRPGHHLGVVYGRLQAGWLTSNDYRNNDELYEIRYQRRFSADLALDVRFRVRDELERLSGAGRLQRDYDMYARLTWRYR